MRSFDAVVTVQDPLGGPRTNEPVFVDLPADLSPVGIAAVDESGARLPVQVLDDARMVMPVTIGPDGAPVRVRLYATDDPPAIDPQISTLPPTEDDAVVRLDTGYFDLELCRGTAGGTGSSKWGLRHFRAAFDGVDLLPSGNNAIGGFYGPFFTPENGLINPPEHVVAQVETLVAGPVLHRYRLSGTVPDGLLPELRGKRFAIDWQFTVGAPWFERSYRVDDFTTTIDRHEVRNRITVGDEFESGIGQLHFTRFAATLPTVFRAGDPYAIALADHVEQVLAESSSDRVAAFRQDLGNDIEEANWDFYWRLFSAWEGILGPDDLRRRLAEVRAVAFDAAHSARRPWQVEPSDNGVDVSALPDATIFAGPATKTAEFDPATGRAMVWWTSAASDRFQIVQRRESGWGNWGTNGENERPTLPVGCTIRTAYGPFAESWQRVADMLETPLEVSTTTV